jgi:hypothetical protein
MHRKHQAKMMRRSFRCSWPLRSVLLCCAVVVTAASASPSQLAAAFLQPDTSVVGFRDEDFLIGVPLAPSSSGNRRGHNNRIFDHEDGFLHSAITILREVVGAPPAALAVGSIVLIQHVVRKFRMIPRQRNGVGSLEQQHEITSSSRAIEIDVDVVPVPQEEEEEAPPLMQENVPELEIMPENGPENDIYVNNNREVEEVERSDEQGVPVRSPPDYESLYKELSEKRTTEQERWELLQAELVEQKDYWAARSQTLQYQHELAVQQMRHTLVDLLQDEKIKLQQSFHDQAQELRAKLLRETAEP